MFTKRYWADLAERVVATAAQSAILALGAGQFNVLDADLRTVAGFAAGGALLAFLKGLAAAGVGEDGSASLAPGV